MNANNEFELFREMMSDVAPISQDTVENTTSNNIDSETILARQLSAISHNNDHLSLDYAETLKPDDVVSFKRTGVQEGVFRKLRLGKYEIHARLDLHKYSLKDARDEIVSFLKQCQRMDVRTCTIVHGKGERCHPPAQMKSFVCQWLKQISDVQCFHSTQRHHGGTGAVYVLLRKSQEKKQETRERHLHRRA